MPATVEANITAEDLGLDSTLDLLPSAAGYAALTIGEVVADPQVLPTTVQENLPEESSEENNPNIQVATFNSSL